MLCWKCRCHRVDYKKGFLNGEKKTKNEDGTWKIEKWRKGKKLSEFIVTKIDESSHTFKPKVVTISYDNPPEALTQIEPVYPEDALKKGIEGQIIVQVFINSEGRVKETLIMKGIPNSGLDKAAMEAIRGTSFKPALKSNKPIGVWISIPLNFII